MARLWALGPTSARVGADKLMLPASASRRTPFRSCFGQVQELRYARQIACFRGLNRPRLEMFGEVAGQRRRRAEELDGFLAREACKPRRLVKGREPVGALREALQCRRELRRKAEPQVDRRRQPVLDGFVGVPDNSLEGRDHVSDDVFGRIMEEKGDSPGLRTRGLKMRSDRLDQKRVLRNGKDVGPDRLSVPARD